MGQVMGTVINADWLPNNLLFYVYGTNDWTKTPVDKGGKFGPVDLTDGLYRIKVRRWKDPDNHGLGTKWGWVTSPDPLVVPPGPIVITVDAARPNPGKAPDEAQEQPAVEVKMVSPGKFDSRTLEDVVKWYRQEIREEPREGQPPRPPKLDDYNITITVKEKREGGRAPKHKVSVWAVYEAE